jgi:hypothetical protein
MAVLQKCEAAVDPGVAVNGGFVRTRSSDY